MLLNILCTFCVHFVEHFAYILCTKCSTKCKQNVQQNVPKCRPCIKYIFASNAFLHSYQNAIFLQNALKIRNFTFIPLNDGFERHGYHFGLNILLTFCWTFCLHFVEHFAYILCTKCKQNVQQNAFDAKMYFCKAQQLPFILLTPIIAIGFFACKMSHEFCQIIDIKRFFYLY